MVTIFRGALASLKTNQILIDAYLVLELLLRTSIEGWQDPARTKLFWTVRPYTMVGYLRLNNVYELAKRVESAAVPGAFVECGVWRGGCAGVLAHVAMNAGSGRKTWLFDSFEGLPEPGSMDGALAREYSRGRSSGRLQSVERCVGRVEDVEHLLFQKLGIKHNSVVIKKGWFQDVLPEAGAEIGPISLLRIDGDWYESTKCCFDHLYSYVVPGGFVIIDDYGHWEGCKKAVNEFANSNGFELNLRPIDSTGVYFMKQ